MQTHVETKHEGVHDNYPCSHCSYEASDLGLLEIHIKSVHGGVFKHSCRQCGELFSKRTNLKRHIQTIHEGLKYNCKQCDYQNQERALLINHIKSEHAGVRYVCKQCFKQFKKKMSLKLHIQKKHDSILDYDPVKIVSDNTDTTNKGIRYY